MNEAAVGIVVPEYIYQIYAYWIGSRQAYHNLLRGRLLSVQEAYECKLIDEVHDMEALLPAAEKEMQRILQVTDNILMYSKYNMRAAMVDRLESLPPVDVKAKLAAWFDPKSRAVMKMVVDRLSK